MYLLRNKISHEYFGVDYEIIWDVAVNYLPENKKQIEAILEEEKDENTTWNWNRWQSFTIGSSLTWFEPNNRSKWE